MYGADSDTTQHLLMLYALSFILDYDLGATHYFSNTNNFKDPFNFKSIFKLLFFLKHK